MPEIIDAVALKYEICEGLDDHLDCELNDKASALYSTFCSIGMILAPILGGPLYDVIGYDGTCDFLAICCLIYSGFYFVFNVGFGIFSRDKQIKYDMEYMRSRITRQPQVFLEEVDEKEEEDIEDSEL